MSDSNFGPPPSNFNDGDGTGGPPRRGDTATLPPTRKPLVTALVIAGVLVVVLGIAAQFWTEVLWYQSVGFSGVFSTQIVTKVLLGVVGGLLTAAVVWSSIHVAYRNRPIYAPSPDTQAMEHYRELVEPMRRTATIAAPLAIGLFAGLSAATQWDTFLLWRNGTPFGTTDPEFGIDIGFFVFDLPWINFVVAFLTMVLVIGFITAAFTHYLYGGIVAGQKMRSTQAARVHLSVIAAALVLVRAVAFWVDRYNLATAQSTRMTGIQYTEAHAVIPTKGILAIAAVMCAVMFIVTIWTRSWRLPLVGVAVLAVIVVAVGGIYPALVQSLKVGPSEKSLEVPYIQRNIDATEAAYGFDQIMVDSYDTNTVAEPRTPFVTMRPRCPASASSTPTSSAPPSSSSRRARATTSSPTCSTSTATSSKASPRTPSSPHASSTSTACPTGSATGSTTTPSTPTATASSRPRATPAGT